MRTTTAAALIAATLLTTLTACSGSDAAAPAAPSISTSPTATYTATDCKALLERNYVDGKVHDASGDPECAGLSHEEYVATASEVVTSHKDDILDQATNEVAWDSAWNQTPKDQRQVVCDRIDADGAEAVGQEMADAAASPTGTETEMLQYFADEKC
ncbi:hypothetical protein [Streptomyces sp. NBC_01022]|uniref:hypothetical protein n=1 Tax=Streptomyces sp. NBC_01022 TaxID=2903723 RepID=UPI002DD7F53A|nr:hypothetical protein [Streptomyces sp. NBC_01022]WRZ84840.1 hypothetical protein OG316_33555 [Streptomyces sp. NBC_01022]